MVLVIVKNLEQIKLAVFLQSMLAAVSKVLNNFYLFV